MNEEEIITFGKYKGERWTQVPAPYLRWLVNNKTQHAHIAKKELERRGTVANKKGITLTGHAIDRFYLRYNKTGMRRKDIKKYGGIYSALTVLTEEALKKMDKQQEKVEHKGLTFVFKFAELDIVLVTVM